MSLYTLDGLREIGQYVDEILESKELFRSQNKMAEVCGVAPNSIKAVRGFRFLTQEEFDRETKPTKGQGKEEKEIVRLTTLLAIAAHIPDPITGKNFDMNDRPCRLERVARWGEPLYGEIKVVSDRGEAISQRLKSRKIAQKTLSPSLQRRLLKGEQPADMAELLQVGHLLFDSYDEMLSFYGLKNIKVSFER